jgi:hypothetical protein
MGIAAMPEIVPPRSILLSGTGAGEDLIFFAHRLTNGHGLAPPQIIEWDSMLRRLLDPDETCWHDPGLWCVLIVWFEDWDHFGDYLRGHNIEPSYALVEKKAGELCHSLGVAARRSKANFCVYIQAWSPAAARCHRVNRFFEDVTERMLDTLADVERVTVLRQGSRDAL